MDKTDKLADLLKRLNSGENPKKIKLEAQEFLSTIDASDLSFAEQKLIEAGLKPEDLRQLCCAHMEMLDNEVERMKKNLNEGHVINTLVLEHEKILSFLDKLDETNAKIQKMDKFSSKRPEFENLKHIAEHLVGAEPHHKREEAVLFVELENKGVFGPPQVMRIEHDALRAQKRELEKLSKDVGKMNFAEFKKKLDSTSKYIVFILRDHIFKENNILYPAALQAIQDGKIWDKMKLECDKIGYCCFTPKA